MGDGLTTIDTTITITKKGESGTDFTADIFGYKESLLDRKIEYTKVIGGLILPRRETAISKEISFEYITTNLDIDNLIGSGLDTDSPDWDTFSNYKVGLVFDNSTDTYIRNFYDANITEWDINISDNVLQGKITFSLPMKNINGDPTMWVGSTTATGSSYDTLMGY